MSSNFIKSLNNDEKNPNRRSLNNYLNKQLEKEYFLACCKVGQKLNGVEDGPVEIYKKINEYHNETNSCVFIPREKFENNPKDGYEILYEKINECFYYEKLPITLGGDHSLAIATISSSLKHFGDELHVIWIDAHADINTPKTSSSGNTHGMPVADLAGLMPRSFPEKLNEGQLTYFGIRDIDEHEFEHMNQMKFEKAEDVETILEKISNKKYIHISFDVDALDPMYMMNTGTKADKGLNYCDVKRIVNHCLKSKKLVALDVVEFNPSQNIETVEKELEIIMNIIDEINKL